MELLQARKERLSTDCSLQKILQFFFFKKWCKIGRLLTELNNAVAKPLPFLTLNNRRAYDQTNVTHILAPTHPLHLFWGNEKF